MQEENLIPDEELETAGIDDIINTYRSHVSITRIDTCAISNNAHEHHEWPVHLIPEQEGMDEKA